MSTQISQLRKQLADAEVVVNDLIVRGIQGYQLENAMANADNFREQINKLESDNTVATAELKAVRERQAAVANELRSLHTEELRLVEKLAGLPRQVSTSATPHSVAAAQDAQAKLNAGEVKLANLLGRQGANDYTVERLMQDNDYYRQRLTELESNTAVLLGLKEAVRTKLVALNEESQKLDASEVELVARIARNKLQKPVQKVEPRQSSSYPSKFDYSEPRQSSSYTAQCQAPKPVVREVPKFSVPVSNREVDNTNESAKEIAKRALRDGCPICNGSYDCSCMKVWRTLGN